MDMLRGEKMENHIKCSMKTSKGRKRVENKTVTKNKGSKQKTVIMLILTKGKWESSLVVQWVKDLALSLQCLGSLLEHRFDPQTRNRHMPWAWPKKIKKKNNKVVVAKIISNRVNFRVREVIRDKEGYFIMIKGPILKEDVIILKMYAPNNRASKYMRQNLMELQAEIDESTVIVGYFNILSQIQKDATERKNIAELKNTVRGINFQNL